MKCIIWNIRGVENKGSQQQLWYYINQQKLNIVLLLEQMVKLDHFCYCSNLKMEKAYANCTNKILVLTDANYELEVLADKE